MNITQEDIKTCITKLATSFDEELFNKTQEELEDYWYYKYDSSASYENNMYNFFDMLELYKSFCDRWEEHHNGSCCVVERVRDKYIMPKIKLYIQELNKTIV